MVDFFYLFHYQIAFSWKHLQFDLKKDTKNSSKFVLYDPKVILKNCSQRLSPTYLDINICLNASTKSCKEYIVNPT